VWVDRAWRKQFHTEFRQPKSDPATIRHSIPVITDSLDSSNPDVPEAGDPAFIGPAVGTRRI
jgi:hypothetical protein